MAIISTELGDIELVLYLEEAPQTAGNFIWLCKYDAYKNASFYRVVRLDNQPYNDVKIEVIQGGLFDDEKIEAEPLIAHETTRETGILHLDGTLSMARNEPGSASTEIFICIGDQPDLDFGGRRNPDGQGFAAFGKVVKGMNVVRDIQALPDTAQFLIDRVVIKKIVIVGGEKRK